MTEPTIVIVAGLRGDAPEHWQSLLAAKHDGARTVAFPDNADWHSLSARVALLDAAVAAVDGPVVLVAHSAGVLVAVHWATQWQAQRPEGAAGAAPDVRGALLATPPDFGVEWPEPHPRPAELAEAGWAPLPRRQLPFPSIVAASRNDPLARYRTTAGLAETWGSRLVDLGDAGHLNTASGYGPWDRADELVAQLSCAAVR